MTERLRANLDDVEARLADAGRVNVLRPLLVRRDAVRPAWEALDVDRKRAVIALLVDVVVHPPGRGTRTFRPETVEVTRRS